MIPIARLETARLVLEPTVAEHDRALADALSEEALYRFIPGAPLSVTQWRERLRRWQGRRSPNGDEQWWNWLARESHAPGAVVGHFQVSLDAHGIAWLGYVVASPQQGRGYAREALQAMIDWLATLPPVREVRASVDARNARSIVLLRRLGLNKISEDGRDHIYALSVSRDS